MANAAIKIPELKKLIGSVKQRMTKLNTFVNDATKSPEQKKSRLEQLECIYNNYLKFHRELIALSEPDDAEALETAFDDFENIYYDIKVKHTDMIKKVQPPGKADASLFFTPPQSKLKVKLPDIKLKSFNGDFDQWLVFRNNFTSLIHQREDLDDIQKFTYLQGVLEGDAARLIEKICLTDAGYNQAWTALNNRYNNSRSIIEHHISNLLNTKPIKSGTATEVQSLIDVFNNRVCELKSLDQPVQHWDMILVNILSTCLDTESRKAWEFEIGSKKLPTYDQMQTFLNDRVIVLRNVQRQSSSSNTSNQKSNGRPDSAAKSSNTSKSSRSFVTNAEKNEKSKRKYTCNICECPNHHAQQCDKFLQQSTDDRMATVNRLELCTNCLKKGHLVDQCESRCCKLCNKKHNTLLHLYFDKENDNNSTSQTNVNHSTTLSPESQLLVHQTTSTGNRTQVILSTAVVFIQDVHGSHQRCRILLDSASQSNFISLDLVNKLGLKKCQTFNNITGLNDMNTIIRSKIQAEIKSRFNDSTFSIECLVVPKITKVLPSETIRIDDRHLHLIPTTKLADPEFSTPAKIDLLIGGELFFKILKDGRITLDDIGLVLQNSQLGYIVGGKISHQTFTTQQTFLVQNNDESVIHEELVNLVKQFWELETVKSDKVLSADETKCEEYFQNTHYRNPDGRYVVRLPFRDNNNCSLGDSMYMATKRFSYLERKLQRDGELKQQYTTFMNEYLQMNHMSVMPSDQADMTSSMGQSTNQYVLPHHAILKPSSTTTKLRVVFDASAKTSNGKSLNDVLLVGPTIQDDLFSIVLRFRRFKFAFTADIEKMYRMIEVHPEDRKFQRILWRQSPEKPLQLYELNTVTYGTSSAPYLATKVLQQIAADEGQNFPNAAEAINDFYMDDVMTGADDLESALRLQSELISMLRTAGMHLRKFSCNSNVLFDIIPESDRELHDSGDDTIQSIKTLGLIWEPKSDEFRINVNCDALDTTITKRTVLSRIAGIFDPLGVLGPIIVKAKIFLQQLWVLQLTWDDSLPPAHKEYWNSFQQQLPHIKNISIPRCIVPENNVTYELHGFCDASQIAYGAVVYMRCVDQDGTSHVNLLCSKSRVAPLKKITIPRMELCGAVLLTRLILQVRSAMKIQFDDIHLWSDSTIVLNWIKTPSNQLKTFVGNRIAEIQNINFPVQWHHIDTRNNPADLISRGLMPEELQDAHLWWCGPSNLNSLLHDFKQNDFTPCEEFKQEFIEQKLTFSTVDDNENLIEKFSKFERLVNVMAYVRRFINNCRVKKDSSKNRICCDYIKVNERRQAIQSIVFMVQRQNFPSEIESLRKTGEVDSKSRLRCLNPFLDSNQIIRVGGRLGSSHLSYNTKHPYILPKKNQFTDLVLRYYHEVQLHCGAQALLGHVRQQYWILQGKTKAKQISRSCITCFKSKPIPGKQLMGQLPLDRVEPDSLFEKTGVDYCGPFLTTTNGRRTTREKSYVAIFVCSSTKAIHTEVVSRLTTDCFIAALQRFTSRRGYPEIMKSDNGTNFVGAAKELKEIHEFLRQSKKSIETFCTSKSIVWEFIPPRSPHFGGLWEAGVKSFKTHFKRVAQDQVLTFEELYTLATQIEACLNSRPLIPLSDDPNDLEVLTPGHFLIGRPLIAVPEREEPGPVINLLKRWRRLNRMKQVFWQKWSTEYITTLQQRAKWDKSYPNLKVDDLVLVKQEGLPSTQWLVGRVVKLYFGPDEKVRVADIKTKNAVITRVIHKLCPFPKEVNQPVEA